MIIYFDFDIKILYVERYGAANMWMPRTVINESDLIAENKCKNVASINKSSLFYYLLFIKWCICCMLITIICRFLKFYSIDFD